MSKFRIRLESCGHSYDMEYRESLPGAARCAGKRIREARKWDRTRAVRAIVEARVSEYSWEEVVAIESPSDGVFNVRRVTAGDRRSVKRAKERIEELHSEIRHACDAEFFDWIAFMNDRMEVAK